MNSLFQEQMDAQKNGMSYAVLHVVKNEGTSPAIVGKKMLLLSNGKTFGTVGGGSYERCALEDAQRALSSGNSYLKEYHHIPKDEDPGLGCAFTAWLYVEIVRPAPMLVVCGGGHVGRCLLTLAKYAGFRTILLDIYEACADNSDADMTFICTSYKEGILSADIPDDAYYFCGAGKHTEDKSALEGILKREFTYAGMLGSIKKAKEIFRQLAEMGYDTGLFKQVYTPVGLDICDMSPQEVAFSVMAEILMIKNNGSGRPRRERNANQLYGENE